MHAIYTNLLTDSVVLRLIRCLSFMRQFRLLLSLCRLPRQYLSNRFRQHLCPRCPRYLDSRFQHRCCPYFRNCPLPRFRFPNLLSPDSFQNSSHRDSYLIRLPHLRLRHIPDRCIRQPFRRCNHSAHMYPSRRFRFLPRNMNPGSCHNCPNTRSRCPYCTNRCCLRLLYCRTNRCRRVLLCQSSSKLPPFLPPPSEIH